VGFVLLNLWFSLCYFVGHDIVGEKMVNLTLKNNPLMCQCFNGFIKPAEPNFDLEVYLPNQKREWECNFVLRMSILHLSTIFLVDFGNVPTAWYFLFFFSLYQLARCIFKYYKCT
jgi:hypothetical protein